MAPFNYSAVAARRRVNRFVADEISYLLRAEEPVLVASERTVWRVPVVLTFPDAGAVGQAGAVDVDVENGRLLLTPAQIELIHNSALELAARHAASRSAS